MGLTDPVLQGARGVGERPPTNPPQPLAGDAVVVRVEVVRVAAPGLLEEPLGLLLAREVPAVAILRGYRNGREGRDDERECGYDLSCRSRDARCGSPPPFGDPSSNGGSRRLDAARGGAYCRWAGTAAEMRGSRGSRRPARSRELRVSRVLDVRGVSEEDQVDDVPSSRAGSQSLEDADRVSATIGIGPWSASTRRGRGRKGPRVARNENEMDDDHHRVRGGARPCASRAGTRGLRDLRAVLEGDKYWHPKALGRECEILRPRRADAE